MFAHDDGQTMNSQSEEMKARLQNSNVDFCLLCAFGISKRFIRSIKFGWNTDGSLKPEGV